jgi:hypothetical protein
VHKQQSSLASSYLYAPFGSGVDADFTIFFLQPITNLWSAQSATLLERLGQPPEVAAPASKFLQITAAGLPGYAIGEIAKYSNCVYSLQTYADVRNRRYLTSQGKRRVE